MFRALVAWGAGDKANEDGFTMCMEKFENNDIRRVLAFISELMIVVLQSPWNGLRQSATTVATGRKDSIGLVKRAFVIPVR
jgi:hypothetical protein